MMMEKDYLHHCIESKNINLDTLSQYFHLPILEVSKALNIGVTRLKQISRRFGIKRWPQRQLSAINKRITLLEEELKIATNADSKWGQEAIQRVQAELSKMRDEKASLLSRPSSVVLEPPKRRRSRAKVKAIVESRRPQQTETTFQPSGESHPTWSGAAALSQPLPPPQSHHHPTFSSHSPPRPHSPSHVSPGSHSLSKSESNRLLQSQSLATSHRSLTIVSPPISLSSHSNTTSTPTNTSSLQLAPTPYDMGWLSGSHGRERKLSSADILLHVAGVKLEEPDYKLNVKPLGATRPSGNTMSPQDPRNTVPDWFKEDFQKMKPLTCSNAETSQALTNSSHASQ